MYRAAVTCLASFVLVQVPVPVILTGNDIADGFYSDVPADLLGRGDWLGLYVSASGSRLAATPIEFTQVGTEQYPEYEIMTSPADPVLLFAGVPGLTPGDVVTISRWPVNLAAAQPRALFELDARDYVVALSASDPNLCDATITLELGDRSQTLHTAADARFACDEPHFDVVWAGDLDRDGALDLVVEFSSKYSHHPRALLLSSAAQTSDLVGEPVLYDKTAS